MRMLKSLRMLNSVAHSAFSIAVRNCLINRIWESVQCDDGHAEVLARELGVSPVTARCSAFAAWARSRRAPVPAPRLEDLHDPFALADMAIAVDRILAAIAAKERIAVHGDYDVDGVTSTVILRRALELLGADVVHFPRTLSGRYGLQPATIDRLHGDGIHLIISVDAASRG